MADSQDDTKLKAQINQVATVSAERGNGQYALQKFASELTTKVRELDKMEREYQIVPGQATEILSGMIENFVYTMVKTLERRDEVIDLAEQDRLAKMILANPQESV